jgi:hypothetical protein
MIPRDGTLTCMVSRDGTLNKHDTQGWNFKQAWYPEMELLKWGDQS